MTVRRNDFIKPTRRHADPAFLRTLDEEHNVHIQLVFALQLRGSKYGGDQRAFVVGDAATWQEATGNTRQEAARNRQPQVRPCSQLVTQRNQRQWWVVVDGHTDRTNRWLVIDATQGMYVQPCITQLLVNEHQTHKRMRARVCACVYRKCIHSGC